MIFNNLNKGNKSDVDDEEPSKYNQREVSYEEGANIAAELKVLFIETSAKTGHNVNCAFFGLFLLFFSFYFVNQLIVNETTGIVREVLKTRDALPFTNKQKDNKKRCVLA